MNFLKTLSAVRAGNAPRKAGSQAEVLARIDGDISTMITRGRFMGEDLGSVGPNFVHAYVMRADGGVEDLGWSHNLKTTVGMDWLHNMMGGVAVPTTSSPGTATSATSVTGTGSGLTASALVGYRVQMPITGLTTPGVYGNIVSNTTSVINVDQWWTPTDTTGTTPASTSAYWISPGGLGSARFIGLTTDSGAPAVGDTALTSEITTNGLQRALAAFAHTGGTTTFTLSKTFTASGTFTAVHKAGLFTGGYGAAGGGILVADTVLNADATLASGDSIAVTWTWTLPSAG